MKALVCVGVWLATVLFPLSIYAPLTIRGVQLTMQHITDSDHQVIVSHILSSDFRDLRAAADFLKRLLNIIESTVFLYLVS